MRIIAHAYSYFSVRRSKMEALVCAREVKLHTPAYTDVFFSAFAAPSRRRSGLLALNIFTKIPMDSTLALVQPQNVASTQNVAPNAICRNCSPEMSQLTQYVVCLSQNVATQNVAPFYRFFCKMSQHFTRMYLLVSRKIVN